MLHYYFILGLPLDADDQAIRQRYLQLIQQYPPERYPEKFKKIIQAYEALKTPRERIRTRLLGDNTIHHAEQKIRDLVDAV
jgi:curved DNA-binding protein CbpA